MTFPKTIIIPNKTKKGIPKSKQDEIAKELNTYTAELDKVNSKYKEQLQLRNKVFLQQLITNFN